MVLVLGPVGPDLRPDLDLTWDLDLDLSLTIKLNKGYSENYEEEYDFYSEEKEEEVSNDHVVKEGSYLEKSKNKNFGVGHTMESHTNETVWKTGNKCFTGLYM